MQQLGELGDHQQPGHGGGQTGICEDIAVADVAEFVGDDRLQLIAIQRLQCPMRHHDDRIVDPIPAAKLLMPGSSSYADGGTGMPEAVASITTLRSCCSLKSVGLGSRRRPRGLNHSPAALAQRLIAAKGDEETDQHDESQSSKAATVKQLRIEPRLQTDERRDKINWAEANPGQHADEVDGD